MLYGPLTCTDDGSCCELAHRSTSAGVHELGSRRSVSVRLSALTGEAGRSANEISVPRNADGDRPSSCRRAEPQLADDRQRSADHRDARERTGGRRLDEIQRDRWWVTPAIVATPEPIWHCGGRRGRAQACAGADLLVDQEPRRQADRDVLGSVAGGLAEADRQLQRAGWLRLRSRRRG